MLTPQFLTTHWPLTAVSLGETFQSYPSRTVIRVHAAEGEFVAKIDSQPPPIETAQKTYAVYDFLAARHFPHIPSLFKTTRGLPLVITNQHSVTVMEYIDGGHPAPTPATWHGLGQIAAALNALPDYPFPYAIPTLGVIRELTQDADTHPAQAQFRAFIDLLPPLVDYPHHGLIHGEINCSNAMQRRNGDLVLIDWDETGTGATVLDAGYPLLTVFLTEDLHFQKDLAAAFYHAYYAQNQPDDHEKDLLFRSALLHALRYMKYANQQKRWDRICYAVAHQDSLLSAIF